jgi:hypothetical protein
MLPAYAGVADVGEAANRPSVRQHHLTGWADGGAAMVASMILFLHQINTQGGGGGRVTANKILYS